MKTVSVDRVIVTMTESECDICFDNETTETYLIKWRIKPNSRVYPGTIVLLYGNNNSDVNAKQSCDLKKLKTTLGGIVTHLLKAEGDKIDVGCPVLRLQKCTHSVAWKNMCADCGLDLTKCDQDVHGRVVATIPVIHSVPDLLVNLEVAQKLGKADQICLLKSRKLVLIMDLEHTLIHTGINMSHKRENVFPLQLKEWQTQRCQTIIRPGTKEFLDKMSRLFQLHLCTFATREYSQAVMKLLDEDGRYFSYRVISKDECVDFNSKAANLRNLFPCGDNLVCIIDDRQDVWDFAPNFVNVKPYYVFLCGLKKPSKHFAIRNKLHSNVIIDPEDVYKSASCAKQQEDDVVASLDESLAIGLQENELKKQVTTSKTTLDDNSCKTLENSDERGSSLETVVECSTTLIGDKIDEDADNYFSFLTNILTRIHKRFYKLHDNYIRQNCQELISEHYHLPDLKTIIPSMSKRVLRGVNIIFSGVHPIREPLERSRLYQVALSLGARVQRRLVAKTKDNEDEATSHVVAARQGTSKVKEAKRLQGIHVVNPGWLWRCAELWEKADEEKFPVIEDTSLRTASSVQPEVPSNLSTEENVNESKNSSVKKSYQETNHGDVIV